MLWCAAGATVLLPGLVVLLPPLLSGDGSSSEAYVGWLPALSVLVVLPVYAAMVALVSTMRALGLSPFLLVLLVARPAGAADLFDPAVPAWKVAYAHHCR